MWAIVNGRRSGNEGLGNPFFEGDWSSLMEWGDHGSGDVIGEEEENMEDVVVVANDLCSFHHSEETAIRVNQVASEILEHEEEIIELDKSHGEALSQVSQLKAELSQLENNLSVETKQEQLIITSNQEDLPSRLAQVLAQLEPFKKKLLKHQVNLDIANSRKERLSKKVPSTDITKLAEAETDATISAEQEEIRKVTRDSKHLTDQDIQFCKEKLTQAELDEQSCLSLLESAKYCLEMAKESKEHLLERQKVLRDYEAGKLEDDSEKTYIKSSCQPEDQQPPPNMTLLV
ncbi:hypothetical protein Tco_1457048 [Tanacetum coccineum]